MADCRDDSEWAIVGEDRASISRFAPSDGVDLDCDEFVGHLDKSVIRPGITLYRMVAESRRAFSLFATDRSPPGTFGLVLPLVGRIDYESADHREPVPVSSGRVFTNTARERWAWMSFPAHSALRIGSLAVERDTLEELCGPAVSAAELRAIQKRSPSFIDVRRGDRRTLQAMSELLAEPYLGRLGHLHREARVLELIASHFENLLGEASGHELPADTARKVRDVRECLDANLRDPPSLPELGRLVGLDARTLNQAFRTQYGTTAFDYLRQARLDTAHRMIGDYPEMPLKEIAWRVGYRHVSNFCNAYRRRFGHSPRHRSDVDSVSEASKYR